MSDTGDKKLSLDEILASVSDGSYKENMDGSIKPTIPYTDNVIKMPIKGKTKDNKNTERPRNLDKSNMDEKEQKRLIEATRSYLILAQANQIAHLNLGIRPAELFFIENENLLIMLETLADKKVLISTLELVIKRYQNVMDNNT